MRVVRPYNFSVIDKAKSYLEYYMQFFGERKHLYVDLLPEAESLAHLDLDAQFTSKDPPPVDRYTHPCWCSPELIYVDELRGNQVWLHKRVQ